MSAQSDLDRLIDWYETNKPDVSRIHISMTPQTVMAFAGTPENGEPILYRGRKIVCLKAPAPRKPVNA